MAERRGNKPNSLIGPPSESQEDSPNEYGNKVASYAEQIGSNPDICKSRFYKTFCEVSGISFNLGDSKRYKEGILKKRSGGRFKHENLCFIKCCGRCCRVWSTRWFIVTSDFVAYLINNEYNTIHEIMLFDSSFKVITDRQTTGRDNAIMLRNTSRELLLQTENPIDKVLWSKAIEDAFNKSEWCPTVPKRFCSFAPERPGNACQWFVDGDGYFAAVYDALKNAKREVYITDWWLSPKIYLKRPVSLAKRGRNESTRLDEILKELGDRGVIVYILLFKEVEMALPLNSAFSKIELTGASSNIRVTRHPRSLVSFWSHHEKMIVIDQEIGFMGGLDLCFGRMDTKEHPLGDLPNEQGEVIFPGQDYNNVRIADFRDVNDAELCLIDRKYQPRMPWHDVAVMLKGKVVKDMVMHFIKYWNHAIIDVTGTMNKGKILNPVFKDSSTNSNDSQQIIEKSPAKGLAEEDKEVFAL